MSTEDKGTRPLLFPDVIEQYEPAPTPSEQAAGPLDAEAHAEFGMDENAPVYADRVDETAPVYSDAGYDETTPVYVDPAAESATQTTPDRIQLDLDQDAEVDEPFSDDPYADAPDWVRAHIPRGPLTVSDSGRRGRSRGPRSTSSPSTVAAADVSPAAIEPQAPSEAGREKRSSRLEGKRLLVVGGAVAAVSVIAAGVVTAVAGGGGETAVPPLPEPAIAATHTTTETTTAAPAAAIPTWCAAVNEPGRVVGNGTGDRDSGPGVIQAFEYAYYIKRDAKAAADLMLMPSSTAEMQGFIDAVPVGTEHCTTILPTADPSKWSVDVLLKFPPLGNEGIHRQWITTTAGDGGMKIALVEGR